MDRANVLTREGLGYSGRERTLGPESDLFGTATSLGHPFGNQCPMIESLHEWIPTLNRPQNLVFSGFSLTLSQTLLEKDSLSG
ncbi:Hypothetical predicted protein [Xyrichtys novacula]|uniref:Uncharacterized protein n=1 Tax=Xyrichtys novacula TaxID=13765 RepID=A0AAV1EI03_XYRNO|nr:Hypothetical predicted protein [Xyrichtys novacula]